MKNLILSLLLTLVCGFTYGSTPWKVVAEKDSVTIESNYQDNDGSRYVVLRVVNNTNQDVTVTFDKRLWYNGNEINSDNSSVTITVPANGYIEGNVNEVDRTNKSLYFFSESLNGRIDSKLTNYEITIN